MGRGPAGSRRLRAVGRLLRASVHVLRGIWIAVLHFPRLGPEARAARIQWWSARTMALMGVRLEASGTPRPGAKLLVGNHISWLDIMAIHAVCPEARFVSKADVKRWPLLGTLVAAAGTLFIERERKRDALRVVHQMAEALQAGQTVAIFPEGTTSDGHALLPFHANLLQAAIASEVPVQPVALRYGSGGDAQTVVAFQRDEHFAGNFIRLLGEPGRIAEVHFLEPLAPAAEEGRRRMAESCRERIVAAMAR